MPGDTQGVPATDFLPRGITIFCQKRLLKMKYNFESSISNVDLGMF